jgi:hypothetical protein
MPIPRRAHGQWWAGWKIASKQVEVVQTVDPNDPLQAFNQPYYRHRRRVARRVYRRTLVSLEVSEDAISCLVDANLLPALSQDDPDKVAAALERLIELVLTADLSLLRP